MNSLLCKKMLPYIALWKKQITSHSKPVNQFLSSERLLHNTIPYFATSILSLQHEYTDHDVELVARRRQVVHVAVVRRVVLVALLLSAGRRRPGGGQSLVLALESTAAAASAALRHRRAPNAAAAPTAAVHRAPQLLKKREKSARAARLIRFLPSHTSYACVCVYFEHLFQCAR